MKGSGVRVPASAFREVPASARDPRSVQIAATREWGPNGVPNGVIWDPIRSSQVPLSRKSGEGYSASRATGVVMAQMPLPFPEEPEGEEPLYLTVAEAAA